MSSIDRPRLEGSVAVRNGRRLSFAEYGAPRGNAVIWMHGTPGGRRQIPLEARAFADEREIRIIAIDRPGIGSSTPHLYDNIYDWTGDLERVLDALAIDTAHIVGLSGGGPYALAAGAALADRIHGVGVIGGVAPSIGSDSISGSIVDIAPYVAPLLSVTRVPLGLILAQAIRIARPVAGKFLDGYAAVQPSGDKALLGRPEFRAMFLDDLLNGARFQVSAPLSDIVLFTRHWGFELSDIEVPVHWWHGDADHIVPFVHGKHVSGRIRGAKFTEIKGESHLGGLGLATDVLEKTLALGPRSATKRKKTT